MPPPRAPLATALAAAALATLVAAGCGGGGSSETHAKPPAPPPVKAAAKRPNVVVVMTDDQTSSAYTRGVMPFTWRFFHHGATDFSEAFDAPPLCCPARAGFLTGEYPHNDGVFTNVPGYPTLRDPASTLPVWLRAAGYRTGLIGKYLNGYETVGGAKPAPGWDRWFAIYGPAYYTNYEVSDDGHVRHFGSAPGDYTTSVLTREAERFVTSRGSRPFFLWLTYNAPHLVPAGEPPCEGDMPQPPDRAAFRRFASTPLPHPPSFNEADVSDKARWVSHRPPMTRATVAAVTRRWRCTLATLPAVDGGVRKVVGALRRSGRLDNTILVFLSDNGYFFGEHRIDDDKRLPYEEAIKVPFAIRLPPRLRDGPSPATVSAPAANIDLAPTLLDYAGGRPCVPGGACRTLDGRSLRPLLDGRRPGWSRDRGILLELADAYTYAAIRTPRYLYARITADRQGRLPAPQEELYDLHADPYELDNLLSGGGGRVSGLRHRLGLRLDLLRRCSGTRPRPGTPDPCE